MSHIKRILLFCLTLVFIALTFNAEVSAGETIGSLGGVDLAPSWTGQGWNISQVGRWGYGPCQHLTVRNDTVYAMNGAYLQIIDFNVVPPVIIGQVLTPSLPEGIALSGRYAYVADHFEGLQVVDLLKPENPVIIGSCETPSEAMDVAVRGRHAYVASSWEGLRVIDVGDPSDPNEVGHFDTSHQSIGVCLDGDYAYVADSGAGLRVISIVDPTSPSEVGFYDAGGYANKVVVQGSYAYVANTTGGLLILDISTPSAPVWAGQHGLGGTFVFDVQVADENRSAIPPPQTDH